MATKLRKMKLTSVDLVRAGANQEADICLFKSADPPEATESPTEPEKNIFKRFIAWLRENPTEDATGPQNRIEKGEEDPDLELIYKSALAESLHSIMNDDTLTEIEKKDMSETSLRQYADKIRELERDEEDYVGGDDIDKDDYPDYDDDYEDDDSDTIEEEIIEEVAERRHERPRHRSRDIDIDEIEEIDITKFNPYHGAGGLFTSASGASAGGTTAGWKKVGRNAMLDKPKGQTNYIQTGSGGGGGSSDKPTLGIREGGAQDYTRATAGRKPNLDIGAKIKGTEVSEHVKTLNSLPTQRGMSKVSYEDIKSYESVLNKMPKGTKLSHAHSGGTDTFERTSDSKIGISWKHTRAPWGKVDNVSSFDVGHWLAGRGAISRGDIKIAN